MLLRSFPNRINRLHPVSGRSFPKMTWVRGLVCVAAVFALAAAYELSSAAPAPQLQNPDKPLLMPDANRPPDANAQMAMHEQQAKNKNVSAANIERKRQISDDSTRLLKLATDLKTEVDKTSKDTLSLGVIRKAEEIEKLAHNVKEKMKLSMNSN